MTDQYIQALIHAFMPDIISVCEDITQLNPLFQNQITNFLINQVASSVFGKLDKLADFTAAMSMREASKLQDMLESLAVIWASGWFLHSQAMMGEWEENSCTKRQ
jgi:Lon-like ATP-dependent protease